MNYQFLALLSISSFALVHLFAKRMQQASFIFHGRFLSFGGGVAISYVFIDLLPKIAKSDFALKKALEGIFPYFERHAYVMALVGFLLFFAVDRAPAAFGKKKAFWLSLCSYALFNFLVGYAIVDKDNPEVQPLLLFTCAMALHYFVNDYSLSQTHGEEYGSKGKWILILSLYVGWMAGVWTTVAPTVIALTSAFIGGGVIMNVTRHELPEQNPHSLGSFVLAAALYTILLLNVG